MVRNHFWPFLYRLLFALCVSHVNCFARQNSDLKLLEARFETHSSGTMMKGTNGSNSLNLYHFKIKILSDKTITFDSLWVNGGVCRTKVSKENSGSNGSAAFKKNAAVTLDATKVNEKNKAKISPPIRYEGAALLRYYKDGKPFFLTIKNIQFQESPNRP